MANIAIGVDLGHCETAAACPQQGVDGEHSVQRLTTAEGNLQVIPTQIILTNAQMEALKGQLHPDYSLLKRIGPFRIGECPAYVADGERFVYFKDAPKNFNEKYGFTDKAKECGITHGMLMACFAYALLENILLYNEDQIRNVERRQIELMVGCPTTGDWTSAKARNEYATLVGKATGVGKVAIIPESRAAMFSSVENSINNISAIEGAVVFDFGSSTADCTYMLLGRKILEFSWTLGASAVEHQMMMEALDATMIQNGPFDADEDKLMEVTNELRKAKEAFYNGMYPPKGAPLVCGFQEAGTKEPMDGIVRINQNFMSKVTEIKDLNILCDSVDKRRGSWQKLCKEFFADAKRRIEASTYKDDKGEEHFCTVGTVIITGGASKMDFIEPLCKEVYSDCTVITNKSNPSHTVSNGLGWIAVTENNLPKCKKSAIAEVKSKQCDQMLVSMLSDVVFDQVLNVCYKQADNWASAEKDSSINDLNAEIKKAISGDEIKKQISIDCQASIERWKQEAGGILEAAVNAQVRKLYTANVAKSLILPTDIWKDLNGEIVDLSGLNIDNLVHMDVGLFSLLGEFLRLFSLGLLDWLFGPAKDESSPRTKSERQNLATKFKLDIPNKREEIMKEVDSQLQTALAKFDDRVPAMLDKAFAIVTLQSFGL